MPKDRHYQGLTMYIRDPDTRVFTAIEPDYIRYFPNDKYSTKKGPAIRITVKGHRWWKSPLTVEKMTGFYEGFVEILGLGK